MLARRSLARLGLLLALTLIVTGCASASAPLVAQDEKPTRDALGGASSNSGTTFEGTAPKALTAASDTLVEGSQVIRTGSLQLQVADVRAAVDAAKAAVTALGGYVSASRETAGDNQPVAVITYRIPAAKWDESLAVLRKLATKVIDEVTDSSDVTSQLVDIDARLKNLRSSETALQDIASKATRVGDVLEVQAQLTQVRGQIESLAAQQKTLQGRVAYATLTVTYGLQLGAVTEASKRWDPAREVDRASASLVGLVQGLASGAIWFGILWLPGLLILSVVLFVLYRVLRRVGLRLPLAPGGQGPAATSQDEPAAQG